MLLPTCLSVMEKAELSPLDSLRAAIGVSTAFMRALQKDSRATPDELSLEANRLAVGLIREDDTLNLEMERRIREIHPDYDPIRIEKAKEEILSFVTRT